MHIKQVGINIHRCPGKGNHSGTEFEFKVLDMWGEEVFHDGLNFTDDSLIFFKNVE